MTGSDNPDEIWNPSHIFKKWDKEDKMRKKGIILSCPVKLCTPTKKTMRKPKKIPEGFEWDPKAKELIDTRCNNPKLRALVESSVNTKDVPALCMSPFFTGTKKKQKELPWQHYPHIAILTTNARLRRLLLGLHLQWTIKEDGQNVTIWKRTKQYCKKKQEIVISSHNQEIAAQDITSRVKISCKEDYEKILALIEDNPTLRVSAEECAKGASITGIKQYDRNTLFVFDIFDTTINNFLSYTQVYQYCYHYGIPVVKLFGVTRHKTLKDLNHFASFVLATCDTVKNYGKDEGMVVKTFNKDGEYIQAKVKLDIPKPIVERIREGPPKLPQIPESEIMGAISHVEADFGLTGEPSHDMPLIAKAVGEECKKHLYSSRGNLFTFYQEYMERRKK